MPGDRNRTYARVLGNERGDDRGGGQQVRRRNPLPPDAEVHRGCELMQDGLGLAEIEVVTVRHGSPLKAGRVARRGRVDPRVEDASRR